MIRVCTPVKAFSTLSEVGKSKRQLPELHVRVTVRTPKITAGCKAERHWECYSLRCECGCHKATVKRPYTYKSQTRKERES